MTEQEEKKIVYDALCDAFSKLSEVCFSLNRTGCLKGEKAHDLIMEAINEYNEANEPKHL